MIIITTSCWCPVYGPTTAYGQQVAGANPKGGPRGHGPLQTMDEKLKLSCRAHMLVLQLPLMTIKQLINIAV